MLARDLGKTVGELSAMPASEIAGWRAFYDIEAKALEARLRDKRAKDLAQGVKRKNVKSRAGK